VQAQITPKFVTVRLVDQVDRQLVGKVDAPNDIRAVPPQEEQWVASLDAFAAYAPWYWLTPESV